MMIVVEQVNIKNDSEVVVTFHSNVGRATATWKGDKPYPGRRYGVDIDIPEEIVGNQNIFLCKTEEFMIREERDTICLRGQVVSGEADECLMINIDGVDGAIVFLGSVEMVLKQGDFVEVQAKKLTFYDNNL